MTHEEIEKVADFMHNQWCHWVKYMFSVMPIPKNNKDYERWRNQMRTRYKDLPEEQKESDRKWAIKLLRLIK